MMMSVSRAERLSHNGIPAVAVAGAHAGGRGGSRGRSSRARAAGAGAGALLRLHTEDCTGGARRRGPPTATSNVCTPMARNREVCTAGLCGAMRCVALVFVLGCWGGGPACVVAPCAIKPPVDGGDPVCLCEDTQNNVWDMSGLGLDQGPGGSSHVTTGACSGSNCVGEYMYHLGICQNVPDMISSAGGVGSCSATQNVGAYRVASEPGCPPAATCQCEPLAGDFSSPTGTSNTPVVTAIQEGDSIVGVTLEYASTAFSPTIMTKVNIICDRSASSRLPAQTVVANPGTATGGYCGSSWCSAEITWRTPGICEPVGSIGWTLVILMGVCAVVYFGGGIGYGRHRNPPRAGAGVLQHPQGEDWFAWHPHADAWRQLPGLVSDGWRFTQEQYAVARGKTTAKNDWDPIGQDKLNGKAGSHAEVCGHATSTKANAFLWSLSRVPRRC